MKNLKLVACASCLFVFSSSVQAAGTWRIFRCGLGFSARNPWQMVALQDGRVLLADSNFYAIRDPIYETYQGGLAREHGISSTTILDDGRILWAGRGVADILDPSTLSVTPTGNMVDNRNGHSATKLADGKVLVVGPVYMPNAEVYDPTTGLWSQTGPLHFGRGGGHRATLLPDGWVLVTGTAGRSAETYNPEDNSWTLTADMNEARSEHSASLLPDGSVLVAGPTTAEVYDAVSGSWTPFGRLRETRPSHAVATLLDGRILFIGGGYFSGSIFGSYYLNSTEIYDPLQGRFVASPSMGYSRRAANALTLPSGSIFVSGGYNDVAWDEFSTWETEVTECELFETN